MKFYSSGRKGRKYQREEEDVVKYESSGNDSGSTINKHG